MSSAENNLSEKESLQLIHQMISQAKINITDSGISWLVWGIMLFLTSISTYIFVDIGAANIFLGWNIFGGITIVLLIYDLLRSKHKKPVRTYVDDLMRYVDISFMVCMFVIIFSMNTAVDPNVGFGYFLMIFGFLMLVKGGATKSTSLIIGAAVNWAGAIAIFLNKEFKYDMLIMAAAVLTGYIIPGLLLWRRDKKERAMYQK